MAAPGGGAAMDPPHAAGLESRARSAGTVWGRKTNVSRCLLELRAIIALQEQGRKTFAGSCEEKLCENREGLCCLREAVQGDVHALGTVQKKLAGKDRGKLTITEAYGEQKHLGVALSRKTVEVAQEKLWAGIFARVNKSNLLLYQLRQRSRARDELQRRLQELQNNQQQQEQVIRQLQDSIEKMQTKVRAGQKVTALYLAVRDVLRKELTRLPLSRDLLGGMARLYGGELEHTELLALDVRKATAGTKDASLSRDELTNICQSLRQPRTLLQQGHG